MKEKIEQDIRKDMNKVPEEGEVEGEAEPVPKEPVVREKMKQREVPMFLIYFQIFDNVTKKNIVEFEDFSSSKVKPSLVKKDAQATLDRIIASKTPKETTLGTPAAFENHNWTYHITKKNWVIMRELISFFAQKVQKV